MYLENQLLSNSLFDKIYRIGQAKPSNKAAKDLVFLSANVKCSVEHLRNLTINREGEFTFLPKGKECVLSEDGNHWAKVNRQSGKIGKTLRKALTQFNYEVEDKDIEEIVNSLKASSLDNFEFTILRGEDMLPYFKYDKFDTENNIGSLDNSCMRHEQCQSWFGIYTENDVVSMLVLRNPHTDLIIGRAMVWDNKYMDRIYGSDSTVERFKLYARDNNMLHKERQSYDDDTGFIRYVDGVPQEIDIEVTFSGLDTDFDSYPYLDTFKYGGNGWLSNDSDTDHDYVYSDWKGNREGNAERVWDEINEEYIDEEEAVYLHYRECYCHVHNTTWSDFLNDYIYDNDVIYLHDDTIVHDEYDYCTTYNDERALWDNVFECEYDGHYYLLDDSYYIDELGMTVYHENVHEAYIDAGYVEHDGEWMTEEDYNELMAEEDEAA